MADALLICPEAPYPVRGGGALRTACILEYLAARYRLDVITFREPGAADPRDEFKPGVARNITVIDLPYHSKKHLARGWRNLGRLFRGAPPLVDRFSGFTLPLSRDYDLAVIEHFWCAPYVLQLRKRCARLVLDLHNVESVLLDRCAATEGLAGRAALRRFASSCRRLEQELLPEFDLLIVASEADRQHVGRAVVVPNTIPFVPLPETPLRNEILFSGNMAYHPNVAAARFFSDRIWPKLRARHPELIWRLAGRNADMLALHDNRNIRRVQDFEDAVGTLAGARAAVVPLLSGSGSRFKILEAWAAGVPVVSTRIGAEGLEARPGEHYLEADDPGEFADAVSSVVNDYSLASRLAAAGRALYESRYTWSIAWKRLEWTGL